MKNIGKTFFVTSLIISVYSLFVALNYYLLKIDNLILGMIREMTILPLLFFQHILTIAALVFWIRSKFSFPSYMFFAFILSLCNSIAVWL